LFKKIILENGRNSDCYCFLFNDMFLVTKVKKVASKSKVYLLGKRGNNFRVFFLEFSDFNLKINSEN